MTPTFWIVAGLIAVALIFDYINGFHDAANSIATVVSTRVLSPGHAVIWAAFFNFVAAFTFGTAVASTVGSKMIDIRVVTYAVVLGGLTGAIVWDLITWYYGLPTSSSHALVGGYAFAWIGHFFIEKNRPATFADDGVRKDIPERAGSGEAHRVANNLATLAHRSARVGADVHGDIAALQGRKSAE